MSSKYPGSLYSVSFLFVFCVIGTEETGGDGQEKCPLGGERERGAQEMSCCYQTTSTAPGGPQY